MHKGHPKGKYVMKSAIVYEYCKKGLVMKVFVSSEFSYYQ